MAVTGFTQKQPILRSLSVLPPVVWAPREFEMGEVSICLSDNILVLFPMVYLIGSDRDESFRDIRF
jgi:hypothetical protein